MLEVEHNIAARLCFYRNNIKERDLIYGQLIANESFLCAPLSSMNIVFRVDNVCFVDVIAWESMLTAENT